MFRIKIGDPFLYILCCVLFILRIVTNSNAVFSNILQKSNHQNGTTVMEKPTNQIFCNNFERGFKKFLFNTYVLNSTEKTGHV